MSSENEDDSSAMQVPESINEPEKKPRISYTRDFLISLSELEICKTLPSGFDQSILSEFEDTTKGERPRTHGSLPIQGFRRNDYSSSPPTHGDSRGYGRWDNRSSGWSDKDGDSQSDMDPDSGRRGFGRRNWHNNSEHDGLLGSGSFPRPTAGTSAPKGPTNRSNEAYQPPRPFKAVPHSRPNTHDSFNDETFGSSESTSQDRAEEERKRRASFELMRKEQQKVLQEKQKSSGTKLKNDGFTDLIIEETKEEGFEAVKSVTKDDSGKPLQSSKPRPLVPPGFKTTITEKTSSIKPTSSIEKEGNHTQNGTLENQIMKISGFPEVQESVNGEETTSILGKFFGSGPTTKDGGPTSFLEQKIKPDDPMSPHNVQSSRFAQWFNEDEKKPVDDISSNRPNNLLSLIGGGDKAIISTDPFAPELSGITKMPSDPKQLYNSFMQESASVPVLVPPVAAVLTCEDLEQTILSEYTEKSSTLQPPAPDWPVSHQENVNNHATNHLLSLLQKGNSVDDTTPNTNTSPLEDRSEKSKSKSKDAIQEGNSGQNLSLEALFGTAFMKELQSGQAPVSAQRGFPGSARIDISSDLSGPLMNGPLSSNVDGIMPNMKQPVKSDEPERWLHFDGQRANVDPPKLGEFHLPEEESLIMAADPVNTRNQNMGKNLLQSDVAFDITEKLAALNSGNRFVRGPYDILEPERQFPNNNNLHALMNHNRRPMLNPMDPMNNTQMRYPDHVNQQFPTRPGPFNHPDANRVTGFDVPVHPQMLPPQMQMPPQLLARPGREAAMHGFPFAHQQANIGGLGMPLPVGDGQPEAFRRMMEMEMEMRARSKQQNNSQQMYRYR